MTTNSRTSDLKVVYCLTSSGGDLYEAMTRVSLATVRLTNPTARIEIACDQRTHHALHATCSQLLREADTVHGFPTPDGPPIFRNRFVKTQLRQLLSGPFLFIDSDTVVRKPLSPLLSLQADIAASPNHSADIQADQIWSEDQANLDVMGWEVREPYLNGGVIWYADTSAAHRFAKAWHCNWLANVERTGRFRDQPALNNAISADPSIHLYILEHCWNAQICMRPDLAEDAIIWHIYSSTGLVKQSRYVQCCQRAMEKSSHPIFSQDVAALAYSASPERPASLLSRLESRLRSKLKSTFKFG